mgnify:CR=1 FL=1
MTAIFDTHAHYDDEAFDIWNKEMGIPAERIFRFGKEDNFWEHGAGPCGPCSEIYYDRGIKYGCGKPENVDERIWSVINMIDTKYNGCEKMSSWDKLLNWIMILVLKR